MRPNIFVVFKRNSPEGNCIFTFYYSKLKNNANVTEVSTFYYKYLFSLVKHLFIDNGLLHFSTFIFIYERIAWGRRLAPSRLF